MKITIDNLDGLGALDYSGWVSTEGPLKIERSLNAPSTCACVLDLSAAGMQKPVRKARVMVTRADGDVLFTGYLATQPESVYAGVGTCGAVYRLALHAVSDEWLLDRQGGPVSGAALVGNGADALAVLTSRVGAGAGALTSTIAGGIGSVGVFEPRPERSWSANAGALADSVYAAYRAVGGVLSLQPAGTVTHSFSDGDGSLQLAGLQVSQRRELANDVTVSGEMEPGVYVAESFAGDGVTNAFALASAPFRHAAADASPTLLSDGFGQGGFDHRVWDVSDPGSHFSFTAAGLTLNGGNGFDGQTTLEAVDAIEMGGSLVLELGSVRLNAASDGVICGLYDGATSRSSCFAGYNVRQSNGFTVVAPLVNGVEMGTVYPLQSGHVYTLRLRVQCVEMQRLRQIYYAMVDGAVQSFGGGLVDAPVDLLFDLQDVGVSSNTPATVLYEGTVQSSPASCGLVALNCIQLFGSIGYCRVTQTGSAAVTKTLASGVNQMQLVGVAGEGVDCTLSAQGEMTFFAGRVPQAGEIVTVRYRTSQRAIVRMEDPASVAAETTGGVPGAAQWRGKVLQPAARSTTDCENAAAALLSVASDPTASTGGSYVAVNPDDIWPGDVLSLTRAGQTANTLVRGVTIVDGMAAPEFVTYHVTFASEWAEGLGIKVSETVATDVMLPLTAQTGPGIFLASLQQLTLVSASGTVLQIDAGIAASVGGGFEVRRRDGGFGASNDQDLVLRSPVRGFSIPREAQAERYYVRMYDGSIPPVYSRYSSAIFTDIPVG